MSAYQVKTEVFEGPLETLLSLIEEKKLDISRISLAAIAENFLAYVKESGRVENNQLASFIWVAATLMLIKSISLLPELKPSTEEEQNIAELERRLKILWEVRQRGEWVRKNYGQRVIFPRLKQEAFVVFSPGRDLNTTNLAVAINGLIKTLPLSDSLPRANIEKKISLAEIIDQLTKRLKQAAEELRFGELVSGQRGRAEIILNFLGILELIKEGNLIAEQEIAFGEIALRGSFSSTDQRLQ